MSNRIHFGKPGNQCFTGVKAVVVFLGSVNLSGKLQELSQLQIKQQDSAGQLSEEVQNVLSAYNSIVSFHQLYMYILGTG